MSLSSVTSLMESNCKINKEKAGFVSLFAIFIMRLIPSSKIYHIGFTSFQFDLLGFPDEVIDEIFSYLGLEDRTRMRLNMRLDKIISKSKYYVAEAFPVKVWYFTYSSDIITNISFSHYLYF